MEFKEYRAKTVNDAITDALIELGTTSDMIEYEVIEEGSAGLLGLFSKNAVVRVRRKEEVQEEVFNIREEIRPRTSLKPEKSEKPEKPVKPEKAEKPEKQEKSDKPVKKAAKPAEKKQEPAEKKPAPAASAANKPAAAPAPAKEQVIISGKDAENKGVRDILNVIFEKLEIKADFETTINETERTVNIVISGDDTGDLIGKRGQTLDAVQYLLSLVINKDRDSYYRVKLDTNNYRERRQKTLENLAKNVASKVKKTRKKVALEPMNPYERRVIHAYLQSDKYVTTKSEGEEPNRRIVVYYKKS